ncbi:HIRAN domain-containing protein [Gammaproteobacteria bacterium]
MKSLYIAWQDPDTRKWHTVGRLTYDGDLYRFVYTKGAEASPRFTYLGRMMDRNKAYLSRTLFPLFANRILTRSRPEYLDYVHWLGMKEDAEPMQLLARSGGRRATDQLCVYPHPEPNAQGEMELLFFSNGLRYLDDAEIQAITHLQPGDELHLSPEDDNTHDHFALTLQTITPIKVGYCPRYLNRDLKRVKEDAPVKVVVERINLASPLQFRLLCKVSFSSQENWALFDTEEHQPLIIKENQSPILVATAA